MERSEVFLPQEGVNLERAKQNNGLHPNSYFTHLPKYPFQTPIGPIFGLILPVGTKIYKGVRHGELCNKVNDPSKEDCKKCLKYTWYSDYKTAKEYSNIVYCFEVIKEIKLLNLLDKRNLDVIVNYLVNEIKNPHFVRPENPALVMRRGRASSENFLAMSPEEMERYREEDNIERNKLNLNYTRKDFIEQLIRLLTPLGYEVNEGSELKKVMEEKKINKFPVHKSNNNDYIPNDRLTNIFGPQKVLTRRSEYFSDLRMIKSLHALVINLDLDFQGYYSPKYRGFAREICVFAPKGFLKHKKDDPLDGCVEQLKGGRTYIKRRRTTKKRLTRKK